MALSAGHKLPAILDRPRMIRCSHLEIGLLWAAIDAGHIAGSAACGASRGMEALDTHEYRHCQFKAHSSDIEAISSNEKASMIRMRSARVPRQAVK